jgi:tripartite-type tricarboxylate transporter receptor subunit TctC
MQRGVPSKAPSFSAGIAMTTARVLAALCSLAVIGLAMAQPTQDYPRRPIRIVTAEPGGGNDFAARVIVQGIGGALGQPLIVDNRGGAGGQIAAEIVARANPDGHTLILYANNIWIIPLLQSKPTYEAVRDFAPITWAAKSANILVVHPSIPVQTVEEFIAYVKARPGKLNYGAGGNGSSTHLAVELFKSMAKVDLVRVTFKGNGPALNALFAGEVQMMIATAGTVTSHLKSGRLKGLAVTSPQPSPLAPGLPTMASAGLPGYESLQIYGVFAPANVSQAIIKRLNQELVRVLGRQEVKDKLVGNGMEPVGSTPQLLGETMKAEIVRIGKVIKDARIERD